MEQKLFHRRPFGDCWCEIFLWTGWMPFLSPNHQCQTEGITVAVTSVIICFCCSCLVIR